MEKFQGKIEVTLLGDFKIVIDGRDFVQSLGGSRKKILLLQYLILNRDRAISIYDLFEMLWPNEENRNPEAALKTLISRLRTNISEFGLPGLIVTKQGGYQWAPRSECAVDVFEAEELCLKLMNDAVLTPENTAEFERVLELYEGDLLPGSGFEGWVVAKSVYYHDLFLKCVGKYLSLLESQERYEDIVRACRQALEIDALDPSLSLELMSALMKMGKNREALAQYEHTTDLHYTQLGVQPPDKILSFYKNLIKIDKASGADIGEIKREILEDDGQKGAFVCEYAIFRDIYNLDMRNLKRLNASIFLVLVTVSTVNDKKVEPLYLDKIMKTVIQVCRDNLRAGDTLSRYSPSQVAILLPLVNYDTGKLVMERVKKSFYRECANANFVFNYKLSPLGD